MKFIVIMVKDLRQTVMDWRTPVFMLIMPVIFTIFFGIAFAENPDADTRVPVALINQDDGFVGAYLESAVGSSTVVRLEDVGDAELAELEAMVADSDLGAYIVIPEGYTPSLMMDEPSQVQVRYDVSTQEGQAANNEIVAILLRALSAVETGRISADQRDFENTSNRLEHVQAVAVSAMDAWESPPLRIETRQGGEQEEVNAYAQSSPGMMIQFAITGIMGSATVLMYERKTKALDRMLSTPTRPAVIITGKLLSGFVLVFVQLLVLAIFGQVFYDLPYLSRPLAFLLLSITFALTLSSMGLLIGGYARNDEAVVILVMIPMFLLSALGGAWFPLEITPTAMQTVGHIVTPTAWAMDGYQDIIIRGLGFQTIILPSLIILAWGAVMFVLAARKLRHI